MKCPGSDIEITVMQCPRCGEEVELFTGESKVKCAGCGNLVTREKASCISGAPAPNSVFITYSKRKGRPSTVKARLMIPKRPAIDRCHDAIRLSCTGNFSAQ